MLVLSLLLLLLLLQLDSCCRFSSSLSLNDEHIVLAVLCSGLAKCTNQAFDSWKRIHFVTKTHRNIAAGRLYVKRHELFKLTSITMCYELAPVFGRKLFTNSSLGICEFKTISENSRSDNGSYYWIFGWIYISVEHLLRNTK